MQELPEALPSAIGAPEPRLITIPISHFCEKAHWAPDRAGIPYREECHVQGVHRMAAHRAGGAGCTSTSLPHLALARAHNCTGVPAWERRMFVPLYPVASRYIKGQLDLTPATVAESEAAVGLTFDAVAERLGDGRRYLCGDVFSAADLAFCCLAASVLMPVEYGVPLPRVDELPAAMAEGVRAFRAHPAGEFALRCSARTGRLRPAEPRP